MAKPKREEPVPLDLLMERGLPAEPEIERYVLGSILINPELYTQVAAMLTTEDFLITANAAIYRAIGALYERSEPIDRALLVSELRRTGDFESVGGLTYLVSLDDGMPSQKDIGGWLAVLKKKSRARHAIYQAQNQTNALLAGEDPDEVIEGSMQKMMALLPDSRNSGPQDAGTIIESYEGGLNAFLQPHLRTQGVPTGLRRLDDMTGGFQYGDLIIIAARPSHGKTSLLLNICAYLAVTQKKRCLIFSLEMSKKSLLHRLICEIARVDSMKFRLGYVNADERKRLAQATALLSQSPLFIDESPSVTEIEIHSRIKKIESQHGKLELIGVDYLQLMASKNRADNRNLELGNITRRLKLTAKELGVPMVVLSQLSRAPEKRTGNYRPMLSDMRESGNIEQDADLVCGIFREELYKRDNDNLRGLAELILLKQRSGPCGTIKLAYIANYCRFETLANDMEEE